MTSKLTVRVAAAAGLVTGLALGQTACGGDSADGEPAPDVNPLLNPAALAATAPADFQVRFTTTKGDFVVDVNREWAPNGADRFYTLVTNGYYDGVRFFRVVEGVIVQFGMHGDPTTNAVWRREPIDDDPVIASNTRGMVTYAKGGPNTRTTQLFINFGDNSRLDADGFAPFGQVSEGMDVVDQLYSGYGELPSLGGSGPISQNIAARGNEYLDEDFPELDHIISATVIGSE